jgi:predicted transcriptional regulator YdeE/predicted enzyme related to lactoylglutathione lyase
MNVQIVRRSFEIIGVRRKCLFKDYGTALPETRERLNHRLDEIMNMTHTQLAVYEMTDEPVNPDRDETFYIGMVVEGESKVPEGMERVIVPEQTFATVTVKGRISEISNGYQALREYIQQRGWQQDNDSYMVELFDDRFDLESDSSEMEIFYPVKINTPIYTKGPVLERIGVIFRHVEDLENARSFYGETLGLQQAWRSSDGAIAYTTGSGPTLIVTKKGSGIESLTDFNFETPDISQAYRSMKANGVEVGQIKIAGSTSMFFFQDPDGHTMMVWANHLPDPELPQYIEES